MQDLPIISCDGCGACCTTLGTPPFVRHEIYDLPEELREEVLRYEREEPFREANNIPCFWYDQTTKRCLQYENRPTVCKDFEVGSPSCLRWRQDAGPDI